MPLIAADRPLVLSAVVMALVALVLWVERRPLGQKLGGPLLLIAAAMLLANLGIIPHSAPLYGAVAAYLVPVAIPLLLLRADLRVIFAESGRMLAAFAVAVVATVAGAFTGSALIGLGPLEAELVGTVTASYIGGSLNFVATAEALGMRDSALYVAALSADAVGAVFFLLALMLLPSLALVRSAMPSAFIGTDGGTTESPAPAAPGASAFSLPGAALALAISLAICATAMALTALADQDALYILLVTLLALVVANFARPLARRASADFELGSLCMYVFFFCIGAGADIGQVFESALPILGFILVMIAVHLLLIVAAGAWLRLDLAEMMIASNACILGPAPAAALAASKGWQPLVAPGILVGMLGYAVATFIGIALAAMLGH